MDVLLQALRVARQAHAGQVDKGGSPYLGHVMRVAATVAQGGDELQAVALLHDVVEDTDVTLDQLARQGFPTPVIEAVDALTKRDGEEYGDYLDRVCANEWARLVKLADLKDNQDLTRIARPTEHDHYRVIFYQAASDYIQREAA
jgi:(p)ppGpp synthase/HD superfamily hydrolase